MQAPLVEMWTPFSLAERDRRWSAVRRGAARAGFDCIFVPLGNGVDGRYLTGYVAAAVVLPTDDRPPIVISDSLSDRGAVNPWVAEVRRASGGWGSAMATALLELGMDRARIGVSGLKGGTFTHVSTPEGVINHSSYAQVLHRLPHATFEDGTDVVGQARHVKSEEEIAALRQAVAISEAGISALVAAAHPGVELRMVYASVMEAMLELGSEYYPLAISADPPEVANPVRYTTPPFRKRLEPNSLIIPEVTAVWGAALAEEWQPVLLGAVPDAWKLIALQREVYEAGLEMMKPGTTFAEMLASVQNFGTGGGLKVEIAMYGRGLGDDGPRLSSHPGGDGRRPLQLSSAWVWRPTVMTEDGRTRFSWGGMVVVTQRGGESLSRRRHGLATVD